MTSDELRHRDRAELADQYERWLIDIGEYIGCDHLDDRLPHCVITELRKASRPWYEVEMLIGWPRLHELRGLDLACYCGPDAACHADVLLELANKEDRGE